LGSGAENAVAEKPLSKVQSSNALERASAPLTPNKIRAAAGSPMRKSTCVKVDGNAVHVTIKKRKI